MIARAARSWSLADLASALGLEYRGDGAAEIRGTADLASAGPRELAALYDRRQLDAARESAAGVLVVPDALADAFDERPLLLAKAVKAEFARAIDQVHPVPPVEAGVHETASVAADAELADDVFVGPHAVVGPRCRLEGGVMLGAGAVLLEDVTVGQGSVIHPRVVVYPRTEIGPRCLLLAGAVVGSPGFGHAVDGAGKAIRVPHLGRVVLEEEVEVGANATIDRASFGETRLEARARIDNLVQIAHNVRLGSDVMIAAQSGLSGSSSLGRGVVMGGQSGLADHVHVGDGSAVAAKTAVFADVEPGQVVAGIPALPVKLWRRIAVVTQRLPQLFKEHKKLLEESEREEP